MKKYKIYAAGWTHLETTITANSKEEAMKKAKGLNVEDFDEVGNGIENERIEIEEE